MKALYTSAPGEFGLVERPAPALVPEEVIVKVAAAGLCHTDVIIREGVASHVTYPVVPGHEVSGVVEECGPGVRHLKPGDRVAIHTIIPCGQCKACRLGLIPMCDHIDECGSKRDGGFAEYLSVPARCLYPIADHITVQEAAMTEPAANAHSAVRQARVGPGDKVVVIGPGPIGLLAIQFAKLLHPSVLVLVGTRDQRLALGEKLGATHTVNIKRLGAEQELREIVGPGGADVVLECAGTRSSFELAMSLAGMYSRVAIEGVMGVGEMAEISPHDVLVNGMSIIGILGWLTVDFTRALEYMENRLIDVRPLISHQFSLDQWEEAFTMITERKSESMKVELTP